MYVLMVTLNIKPERREQFMEALLGDARGSNEDEPGCLRFDMLQDAEDPNQVHLYEVYRDEAAFKAHQQAPHFVKWRDTVRDWFAGPAVRHVGRNVYPPDAAWR